MADWGDPVPRDPTGVWGAPIPHPDPSVMSGATQEIGDIARSMSGYSPEFRQATGMDDNTISGLINRVGYALPEVALKGAQGLDKAYNDVGEALPHGGLASALWELPQAFPADIPGMEAASEITQGNKALNSAAAAVRPAADLNSDLHDAILLGQFKSPDEVRAFAKQQGSNIQSTDQEIQNSLDYANAHHEAYVRSLADQKAAEPFAPDIQQSAESKAALVQPTDEQLIAAGREIDPNFGTDLPTDRRAVDRGTPDRRDVQTRGTDDTLTTANGNVLPFISRSTQQVEELAAQSPVAQAMAPSLSRMSDEAVSDFHNRLTAVNDPRAIATTVEMQKRGLLPPNSVDTTLGQDLPKAANDAIDHTEGLDMTSLGGQMEYNRRTGQAPIDPNAREEGQGQFSRQQEQIAKQEAAKSGQDTTGMVEQPTQPQQAKAGGKPPEPPEPPSAVDKLRAAVRGAGPVREDQQALYTQELANRAAAGSAAHQELSGVDAYAAGKAALKGELPKADYAPIKDQFTPEEINELHNRIVTHPDLTYFQKVNAGDGLEKMLRGEVPTRSELRHIRTALGDKVADAMEEKVATKGQGELFNQGDVLSQAPAGTPGLSKDLPEKPEKTFFPNKGQGNLFDSRDVPDREIKGQGELFSGAETNSTGPIKTLLPEVKETDPDKFIIPKGQGDFFRQNKGYYKPVEDDWQGQKEMFSGAETNSTGPIKTLLPEVKETDPDKFIVPKGQGDFFRQNKGYYKPVEDDWQGQKEMFSGAETNSTGPIRSLKPEEKTVDPDKFISNKGKQGDFFPDADHGIPDKPGKYPPQPTSGSAFDALANILNAPRAFMSTFDFSAPFNQGVMMIGRPEFWRAFGSMFKQAGSQAYHDAVIRSIMDRPTYPIMERSGLALTGMGDKLNKAEENFMSNLPGQIPGFGAIHRGAERAYSGFLNKLRADTFDRVAQLGQKAGIDIDNDEKWTKALAGYVNNATGRGSLGAKGNAAAPLLNSVFFSPRLQAARVQMMNPVYYARLPPVIRQDAMKTMLSFGAISASILGLAKMSGLGVETDPRSTDFGKIVLPNGKTRYSPLASFQPLIRLGAQILTNEKKPIGGSVETLGVKYGQPTRLDVLHNFLDSKLSPTASFVADNLRGKDLGGNKFDAKSAVVQRLTPLFLQDAYDVIKADGPKGIAESIPGLFGVGMNTFQNHPKKSDQVWGVPDAGASPWGAPTPVTSDAASPWGTPK